MSPGRAVMALINSTVIIWVLAANAATIGGWVVTLVSNLLAILLGVVIVPVGAFLFLAAVISPSVKPRRR